jgi:hypothetical protein
MNSSDVNNREIRDVKRIDVYEEFILWSAMPPTERIKLGIETQEQFSQFYKISINTPTAWKRRHGFEQRVTALRKEWAFSKTGAVIEGIYRSALKGNPHSQKLWLQYFHGFSEKVEVKQTPQIILTANDIRFIIEGMPEPQKSICWDHLRSIMDEAIMLRQKGLLIDALMYEDTSEDGGIKRLYDDVKNELHPEPPVALLPHRALSCADFNYGSLTKASRGGAADF